ncbi:MAG: diacylglycerol kinase family lipid kinase [Chloroflexi bacterium]|nr:diacylglycerol kinase family lipid kinase [Chloroflexota bacterium]
MSRTWIIANPVAGHGKGLARWRSLEPLVQSLDLDPAIRFTDAPGHAGALAWEAAQAGAQLVVAAGGDGTIHEVVNGLIRGSGWIEPGLSLGVLPIGRGNDFVRSVGLPIDPAAAARVLARPTVRPVDVGLVEYQDGGERRFRYFVNVAGVGFDGEVARRALKAGGGAAAYAGAVLGAVVGYQNKRFELQVNGRPVAGRHAAVIVANGPYAAGGMRIAPTADSGDGLMDLVILGDLGRLELLLNFPLVYFGRHTWHPKVSTGLVKSLAVDSPDRPLIQADGELLGQTPATFHVLPGVLPVRR